MSAIGKLFSKSTMVRLFSGIILVLIAILTVHLGGDVLYVTTLCVSLVGLFELYRAFSIEKKKIAFAGYAAAIMYYYLIRDNAYNEYTMILMVLSLMFVCVLYVLTYPEFKPAEVAFVMFGLLYVPVMLSYVYKVRIASGGRYIVWLIYLCSWGCDTFAYIFGVMFGKHKMAPVLSPKKTVEGAIGGVFGSCLCGFLYALYVGDKINSTVDVRIMFVVVCFFGSFISMVGDLAASAIKRHMQIKDYGTLIPGHGGIMDRFDSVIFTAPLIWILVEFMK